MLFFFFFVLQTKGSKHTGSSEAQDLQLLEAARRQAAAGPTSPVSAGPRSPGQSPPKVKIEN